MLDVVIYIICFIYASVNLSRFLATAQESYVSKLCRFILVGAIISRPVYILISLVYRC